jgi:hypothetical protein
MCSIHIGNIDRAIEIDLENLLDHGRIPVAAPVSIALIYQELVIVQGGNFAYA